MGGWGRAGKTVLDSGHVGVLHLIRGRKHGIAHQGFDLGTVATERGIICCIFQKLKDCQLLEIFLLPLSLNTELVTETVLYRVTEVELGRPGWWLRSGFGKLVCAGGGF